MVTNWVDRKQPAQVRPGAPGCRSKHTAAPIPGGASSPTVCSAIPGSRQRSSHGLLLCHACNAGVAHAASGDVFSAGKYIRAFVEQSSLFEGSLCGRLHCRPHCSTFNLLHVFDCDTLPGFPANIPKPAKVDCAGLTVVQHKHREQCFTSPMLYEYAMESRQIPCPLYATNSEHLASCFKHARQARSTITFLIGTAQQVNSHA